MPGAGSLGKTELPSSVKVFLLHDLNFRGCVIVFTLSLLEVEPGKLT